MGYFGILKRAGITAQSALTTFIRDCTFEEDCTFEKAPTFEVEPITEGGVGAAAGTGVVATEYGDGAMHKTVLTFTDVTVAVVDDTGVTGTVAQKVYDFPAGYLYIQGCVTDLALTVSSLGVDVDWDGDVGVGTVTAIGTTPLATTEQDIIPTTATPQASAGATTANAVSTATEHAILDGHTTAIDMFLNILIDDADQDVTSTPCNMIINGTLTIVWTQLGDN